MPHASDGSSHHSFGRARLHDSMNAEKKPKPAMDKPAEKPSEKPAEDSGEDIKSVVAEHGPAHEVHMTHDHEAKKSHVTSHHGEHKHEKDFEGDDHAEMAHKHAHEAAGGEDEEPKDEEMGEEAGEALPEMESEHSRIPGLG